MSPGFNQTCQCPSIPPVVPVPVPVVPVPVPVPSPVVTPIVPTTPVPVPVPTVVVGVMNPMLVFPVDTKLLKPVPKFVFSAVGAVPKPVKPEPKPPRNPFWNELPVKFDPRAPRAILIGKVVVRSRKRSHERVKEVRKCRECCGKCCGNGASRNPCSLWARPEARRRG